MTNDRRATSLQSTEFPAARRTIAILHYAGPPTIGGVELTMAAHARVMAAEGHTVRIIAGQGGPQPAPIETWIDPLLSSRGERIDQVNRELADGIISPAFDQLTNDISTVLASALAGCEIAMVHNVLSLHKNLAFTAALHRLHQQPNAPKLLAWCHDFAWLDPLYQPELHEGYPWDLLRQPWPNTHYVVVSEDRRSMLAGLLKLPAEQITVATPGVDLSGFLKLEESTTKLLQRFPLLDAEPLLLLPARVTRRKNIELAISIVAGLKQLQLRPTLIITGPPGPHNPANASYLAQLQELRHSQQVDENIIFLYETYTDANGKPLSVSDAMLSDFFRLADGLLFPSRYEGFGIPVLEAGLAGIPIFCSDIEPFRESAGDAALFFRLDADPQESAARIAEALRQDRRYRLRRTVRQTYTWDAIYHRVITPLFDA